MTLLETIQETIPAATQEQVSDILQTHNTTEAAVLSKPGKLTAFIGLVEKSQPGGMVTRSAIVSATTATVPTIVTTPPIIHTPSTVKPSTSFSWETATDEECDAEDERLSKLATRSLRKANALKLERQIAATNADIYVVVTIVHTTSTVKPSTSFSWETATDEECDAEDERLSKLAARSLRKANALKLERQIAATNADIYDDEAQTIDFNQKGLDASQELAKQRAMLEVQSASAPRLLQLQIDAATSIATDRITRTEAAIDAGKSAMEKTPLASEIAAFRAKLTQREMMNRATALTNATPALLGASQPEKEVVTIDA